MILPDRSIAPDFKVIHTINLPETTTYTLDNGMPLHVINIGEQPVVRLECIFDGGNRNEVIPGTSLFAIKMLAEGTPDLTSADISEAFDRIGAFTDFSSSSDAAGIVVYCLSRVLPEVLPLVREMMQRATFPSKEMEDLRNISLQNLRVNQEKTSYLATVAFRKGLFGANHPYGQSQNETDLEALTLEQVVGHFDRYIKHGAFTVVMAGKVTDADVEIVKQFLGKEAVSDEAVKDREDISVDSAGQEVLIEKDGLQSTIRMGRKLFTRHHPDYFKMLVTNEILGGYFGSRLMKNIREEKGLTYGISSHVVSLRNAGYFMIGTDVKKEFTQQTIDEIKKEIHLLKTVPVGEEELQTVKNFMAGEFAGSLNTAFEVADRRKLLLLDGLPADFFNHYIDQIHATTSEDIMVMANLYLNPADMLEVVVGGK